MSKYDLMYDIISSDAENGIITLEHADELNKEAFEKYVLDENHIPYDSFFLESFYSLYEEDADRAKENYERFKKEYHYNKKEGTIIVNGQKCKFEVKKAREGEAPNAGMHSLAKTRRTANGKFIKYRRKISNLEFNTNDFDVSWPTIVWKVNHETGHMKDWMNQRVMDRDKSLYNVERRNELDKETRKLLDEYNKEKRLLIQNAKRGKYTREEYTHKLSLIKQKFSKIKEEIKKTEAYKGDKAEQLRDVYADQDKVIEQHISTNSDKLNKHDDKASEYRADLIATLNSKRNNQTNDPIKQLKDSTTVGVNKRLEDASFRRIMLKSMRSQMERKYPNATKAQISDLVDKAYEKKRKSGQLEKDRKKILNSQLSSIEARAKGLDKMLKVNGNNVMIESAKGMYESIYESLQDKVNNGELTLEDANILNDLAYDRYMK